MKGIAGITGTSSPQVGKDAFYEVTKLYPGTVISNYNTVKWKVFRESGGNWTELKGTLKTGKKVSFNFPQKWYGKRLLIEAYLSTPEVKSPPGLIVKPIAGQKKIKEVVIKDANGNALTKSPKYGQNITAQVLTENMLGDTLTLSLWERDTMTSTGHDPSSNQKLWSGTVKVTDATGKASKKILLSPAMMADANKSMFEGGEHEYYMVVQADSAPAKVSTQTVAVQNEIVLSPNAPKPKTPTPAKKEDDEPGIFQQLALKILNAFGIDEMPGTGQTNTTVNTNKVVNCGERYCIKKGSPKSELIREINIRLSGFGGNVPTDEFTDRTEKMVKQFQKDYMKVPETGRVCGNTLLAIDDFSTKFDVTSAFWGMLKCDCTGRGTKKVSKLRGISEMNNCAGFGDGTGKGTYRGDTTREAMHKYEYPGIHRSLLFGFKALQFYISKQTTYSIGLISSGYRCRFMQRVTTNHQGKAIDIQFNKGTWLIRGQVYKNIQALTDIRDNIVIKNLNAKSSWTSPNNYGLEPIGLNKDNTKIDGNHTYSWIHMDVREFESAYLEDKYFCKNQSQLNGNSIVQIAKDLKFDKTCACIEKSDKPEGAAKAVVAGSCEDKFKRVAPIILKHEGGYVNNKNDSGGHTNKGITLATFESYAKTDLGIEPTLDNLKALTDEQATTIYRKRYWEPKGFCDIEDEKVALMIYDWSITSGGAAKQVQKLLVNEYSQDIPTDGGFGPKTVKAVNAVDDQAKLLTRIGEIRKEYYTDLAYTKDGKPSKNYEFLDGWHKRVDACLNYKFD